MSHRLSRYMLVLRTRTITAAAALLLLVGVLAMVYQFRASNAERQRELQAQAHTLAASVTAAIAFNDHVAAREYVEALMLDPRLDAVAVFDDSGKLIAGEHRPGVVPLMPFRGAGLRSDSLLLTVPARQGEMTIGSVWLRAAQTPLAMQLARLSGVALLTVMAVLMLFVLARAQRVLARANAETSRRAEQLAEANRRLTQEMENRSRAEAALRQSQKMEAVGHLSGGIAHDFNNVLMVVKTALSMLEKRLARNAGDIERWTAQGRARLAREGGRDADDKDIAWARAGIAFAEEATARQAQVARYFQVAHDGIDRAADLTRRLLAFARRQPLAATRLQLDPLVRGIQPLLEHSVGARVQLETQLASRWELLADGNLMENAILNLVINARDAMPTGGRITISTADEPAIEGATGVLGVDHVRLLVTDTGTGMSEEVRSRALDPFFTTKPVGKGTGLGLSTILGYVLQLNGEIGIDSEPGMGTTVRIVLPRAHAMNETTA